MRERLITPEILDRAPDGEARANLADIVRINRYFGGHAALLRELGRLEPRHASFTVLDVGAASGDHARSIRARFPNAEIVSLDLHARNLAAAPDPRLQADAFRLPVAAQSVDYVCCNLFLHHFSAHEIVSLLRDFAVIARKAVLVTDLERRHTAHHFLPATRWLFGWHPVTLHDGPASVRAGFRPHELERLAIEAGLKPYPVRRHLPWFRLSMIATALALLALLGCAKRYAMEGMVLRVDPGRREMTVSHRAVPGFMPAMAMPFQVGGNHELAGVHPGAQVRFDLRVSKDGSMARSVRVVRPAVDPETPLEAPAERIAIGGPVPEFELTDQDGIPFRASDLRGRLTAINFIYSRCPLPEVCPRLAAGFASLQRRFRTEMPHRLALVSVTLDPTYDQPAVLKQYAESLAADPSRWRFLTGDTAPVARSFGLVHWPEEGVIVHSSVTALVDPEGRLAALVEGASFRLEQIADLIADRLKR